MSDFVMRKGDVTESVPSTEVRARQLAGWTVVRGEAMQVFTDNRTGEQRLRRLRVTGPEGEAALARDDIHVGSQELDSLYAAQRQTEEEDAQREAFGGLGGAAREFAMSAADELTFGGLTAAARRGSEAFGQSRDTSMEVNPRAAMAGRIGGIVAGVALPIPAWARGFSGAGGVSMAAGQLLRGAASGRRLQGLGRVGAGVAEGAIGGSLDAVTEANITGDYEGLSERMLQSGTIGALLGFGVEAGGALRGFVRSERQGVEAALGTGGDSVDDIVRQMTDNEPTRDGFMGSIQRLFGGTPMPDRRIVADAEDVLRGGQEFWAGFADEAGGAWSLGQRVLDDLSLDALMKRGLRERIEGVASAAVARGGDRLRGLATDVARGLKVDGVQGAANGFATRLGQIFGDVADDGATRVGARAQARSAADQVQDLITLRQEIQSARSRASAGGIDRFKERGLEQLAKGIDEVLHGADMGELGAFLRDRDALVGDLLTARDDMARHVGNSLRDGRVNGAGLAGELRGFAESGSSESINAVIQQVDSLGQAHRRAKDLGIDVSGLTPPDPAKLQGMVRRAKNYQKFREALHQQYQSAGIGAALGVGALGGLAFSNPIAGVALGAAVLALSKPVNTARMLEVMRRMIGKQDARIADAYSDVQKSLRSGIPASSRLSAAAGSIAHVYLNSPTKERRERYEDMASRVEKYALNPQSLTEELSLETLGADALHPQLPTALGGGSMRAMGALINALPPSRTSRRRGGFQALPGLTLPASDTEMDDFLEAASVVEDPIFGVELLAAGRLGNSGARAIEQAYPAFYAEFTSAVVRDLSEAHESGVTPDYATVTQLSNLMGMPMDQTLEPDFILAMQETYAQTSEQERAVRSPQTLHREMSNMAASHTRVTSQSLEESP